MRLHVRLVGLLVPFALLSCGSAPPQPPLWALAIHGGAGTLGKGASPEKLKEFEDAIAGVLTDGRNRLAKGDSALDVCEAIIRKLEDDPHFNAGKGAVFNEKGEHELDASIMDGSTLACGAVAGVRTVRHPITLARLVMEKTPHVLLMGDGAEKFADAQDPTIIERVPNNWFDTEHRRKALDDALKARTQTGAAMKPTQQQSYGTVGCVALDAQGRLVAATSTGGMTAKRWGRVGDSPVIGAGNYADRMVAVSCTGTGEQFIRHVVGHDVSARMQYGHQNLDDAVRSIVTGTLQPGDGGLIAVDRQGNVTAQFNSEGMYHGIADARGRFIVRTFEE